MTEKKPAPLSLKEKVQLVLGAIFMFFVIFGYVMIAINFGIEGVLLYLLMCGIFFAINFMAGLTFLTLPGYYGMVIVVLWLVR